MDHFDKKLRQMAAEDKLEVPERLHLRLTEPAQTARRNPRFMARKVVLLAAAIGILGVVTAGATFTMSWMDMGYYEAPKPAAGTELESEPTQLEESVKEVIREELDDSAAEAMIGGIESGEIHLRTQEETLAEEEQYEDYETRYQSETCREEALRAAEEAFTDHGLWDAEVLGARFEGVQIDPVYGAEVLVVLYLSDGCGYRMLLDADTLELVQAFGLPLETMESEYFDALWNGTVDAYNAEEQAKNAAG